MKVRDILGDWPLQKWTADDSPGARTFEGEPGELRLLWFTVPDAEGWFRVTATDAEERGWSTFCRVEDSGMWPALEITLSHKLRAQLREIGGVDIEPEA